LVVLDLVQLVEELIRDPPVDDEAVQRAGRSAVQVPGDKPSRVRGDRAVEPGCSVEAALDAKLVDRSGNADGERLVSVVPANRGARTVVVGPGDPHEWWRSADDS
jgi:hypothetical protein